MPYEQFIAIGHETLLSTVLTVTPVLLAGLVIDEAGERIAELRGRQRMVAAAHVAPRGRGLSLGNGHVGTCAVDQKASDEARRVSSGGRETADEAAGAR